MRASTKIKTITTGALVALSCLGCKHEGNILLRLKYYPGEKVDVRYRTYTITGNENDEPLVNEMTRFGLSVDSVASDSLYKLSARIDYIRAKNNDLLGTEYSSDKDESEMTFQEKAVHSQLKPLIDSVYKLTINNRGEILKPIAYANGVTPARTLINYANYQPVFPKNKIAIGDEWTAPIGLNKTSRKRECTYHIESIYNSTIQIKVTGKMETSTGEMKDFSGRYMIDQKTCELISAKIEIPISSYPNKLTGIIDIESH